MNIFKGLLYLQGQLNDPREAGHDYGQTYGNAQAFSKQLAEPWELDVGQVALFASVERAGGVAAPPVVPGAVIRS